MVTLRSGELVCDIEPSLGGCIAGLRLGGVPVLRCAPQGGLTSARQAGSYPLVPFSNRIGQATLHWQGTHHPLVSNNAPEPHAIHGVGWQRPWQLLDGDEQFALLSYEHRADPAWPFAFDCSQSFRVREGALELTLSLTNQSPRPAPAGLGWHPFFIKRPSSHLRFEASGRWEMGADKLPTHRSLSAGIDSACDLLEVDHCFDGWTGVAELRDTLLHTRVRSSLSRLVVFTNGTRDTVAIEPVSHVNNAISLVNAGADAAGLGLAVLQPGETFSAHMSIEMEHAK
jgi:aldose 1-epimerase